MRTVYTTLPIFDSVSKQEYNRTDGYRPIYSPRFRLPPFQFEVVTGVATIDTIYLVDCDGASTDISAYFANMPALFSLTNYSDYIQYKGEALKTLLPLGCYYLKLVDDDGNNYYSERFVVKDIYPLLKSSLSWSDDMDTFTSSGLSITSAINLAGTAYAYSNDEITSYDGDKIKVVFFHTQNSGEAPSLEFYDDDDANCSQVETVAAGINEFTFTIDTPASGIVKLRFSNTAASNWAAANIWIMRTYSEDYVKLRFTNTKDLPTQENEPHILYQDSFADECWFKRKLNVPEHEVTRIGTEKNGMFIAEKLVVVYRYTLIDWIGRNLFRALHRLSLHDDVTITDTVGNEYDVAHDTIVEISWEYYDIGKMIIKFNDGASRFEGNAANMT